MACESGMRSLNIGDWRLPTLPILSTASARPPPPRACPLKQKHYLRQTLCVKLWEFFLPPGLLLAICFVLCHLILIVLILRYFALMSCLVAFSWDAKGFYSSTQQG